MGTTFWNDFTKQVAIFCLLNKQITIPPIINQLQVCKPSHFPNVAQAASRDGLGSVTSAILTGLIPVSVEVTSPTTLKFSFLAKELDTSGQVSHKGFLPPLFIFSANQPISPKILPTIKKPNTPKIIFCRPVNLGFLIFFRFFLVSSNDFLGSF